MGKDIEMDGCMDTSNAFSGLCVGVWPAKTLITLGIDADD
jgi:hypothetical protein